MGGQDGSRGYLVQTIIALLHSLGDASWEHVTVEPDANQNKVDIQWESRATKRVMQVKSSANQIGKADAERWASELRTGSTADDYLLVLVGPCAQSVAEMGSFNGVTIPTPKSLDITGLLHEAAHLLDRFLDEQGIDRRSASQRELIVNAMTTHLLASSSRGKSIPRADFTRLLREWVGAASSAVDYPWELVSFDRQRGIENAVAGKRLGPSDVEACPEFRICDEIAAELNRSHFYEVVGTPGCGKSITAWHVAKRFHRQGFDIWRPRAFTKAEELIARLPRSHRELLILDDAHQFGPVLAARLSEQSGLATKVLLVSTVQAAVQSSLLCISPGPCVEQLADALLPRREELLPIIRQHDQDVGNNYMETSYEFRVQQARKERTPWEFFWVMRGGWRAARREFESAKQFTGAPEILLLIAVSQIASCDAGVSYEWVEQQTLSAGISGRTLQAAMSHLSRLGLVLHQEEVRTKHISYAYRIVAVCFSQANIDEWPVFRGIVLQCLLGTDWSLKGIAWALESLRSNDAAHSYFSALLEPFMKRVVERSAEVDWAAGAFWHVISFFDVSSERILSYRDLILSWITARTGLVSHFCSNIVNELINHSRRNSDILARQLIDDVDVDRLLTIANAVGIEQFYMFGSLLDRLAYYGPSWAAQFVSGFNWDRAKQLILAAKADRASAIDKFMFGITLLNSPDRKQCNLDYLRDIIPYVTRSVNESPCDTIEDMHGVFWNCLGYTPRFLRGGRSPGPEESEVARTILAGVDPRFFAGAMEDAIPRDLEKLARSYEVIREIDPAYMKRISERLSVEKFLTATREEWKKQSSTLQRIVLYFSDTADHEPAASWIEKCWQYIDGPLSTIFTCIAPKVAIEFHKSGRGVRLLNVQRPYWPEICMAIVELGRIDGTLCAEIVAQQLDGLREAIYVFDPAAARGVLGFLRVLLRTSEELFDRFVRSLDLDNPVARATIEAVKRCSKKEQAEYRRIARYGMRAKGRLGDLAKELAQRLR